MNKDQISQLSFDCVLPSAIFFNENLEPNCIKLYAMVRNLSKMCGHCFATNDYLAQLLNSDISSIKRWLASLSSEGYLEIHTNKEGIHWTREIYLSEKFKKSLRRLKIAPPPAQNCAPPSSKMSHIKEEYLKEEYLKEKEKYKKESPGKEGVAPPDPHLCDSEKKISYFEDGPVKMAIEDYDRLAQKYTLEALGSIIEQMKLYSQINPRKWATYKNYAAVAESWLLKELKKEKPSWTNHKSKIENQQYFNSKETSSAIDSPPLKFVTLASVMETRSSSKDGSKEDKES